MNKWHLSSKVSFLCCVALIPIVILSVVFYSYLFISFALELIKTHEADFLVIMAIYIIALPMIVFSNIIICTHIRIGMSSFWFNEELLLDGFIMRRTYQWSQVTEYGVGDIAFGPLKSHFWIGRESKVAFIIIDGDREYADYIRKYGIVSLLIYWHFEKIGKVGTYLAWFWLNSMQQAVEIPIITPPKKIIWFKYDEQLYCELSNAISQ